MTAASHWEIARLRQYHCPDCGALVKNHDAPAEPHRLDCSERKDIAR